MGVDDFSHLLPPTLVAVELRGSTGVGRSRPLRIQCRTSDRGLVEVIVKLKNPCVADGTPWLACLAREIAGAIIARRLGLSVPDHAFVQITESFARAVASHVEGPRVAASVGVNFGSVVVENIIEDVPIPGDPASWEATLGFDAMIFNADRKPSNPNVLWDGSRLFLIDHGLLAPLWTAHVDGLNGQTLYGEMNIRLHAGAHWLRGTASEHVLPFRWAESITDEFLVWLADRLPPEWVSDSETQTLVAFLRQRRDIIREQSEQLKAVLQ
jgi:hypothetical protein